MRQFTCLFSCVQNTGQETNPTAFTGCLSCFCPLFSFAQNTDQETVSPAFTRCLSCFCPLFHQGFSQISVEAQLNISRFPRHRHFVYPLCYYYCNRENGRFNDCNRKSGRFYDCSGKSGQFIIAAGNWTIQMKGRSYNQICVTDSISYPAAPLRS